MKAGFSGMFNEIATYSNKRYKDTLTAQQFFDKYALPKIKLAADFGSHEVIFTLDEFDPLCKNEYDSLIAILDKEGFAYYEGSAMIVVGWKETE